MRYRHRCTVTGCRTRCTLNHPITWYKRKPKCPSCKRHTLKLDEYRMNNEVNGKGNTCTCDGYHFPHREGSLWCIHSTTEPTEEQQRERYEGGNPY